MIVSMTGFGRTAVQSEELTMSVEVRSVNSRFLDYSSRLPGFLMQFDHKAGRIVRNECERGRVTVTVTVDYNGNLASIPSLNSALVMQYRDLVEQVRDITGRNDDIAIDAYLTLPEVVKMKSAISEEKMEALFLDGLKTAIDEMKSMRLAEGKFLYKDIDQRLTTVSEKVELVLVLAGDHRDESIARYKGRITELMDGQDVDDNRLYMEVSVLASKLDVTEEITRLNSHIGLFRDYLKNPDHAGKKMNFLLQEMGREINTIGSKTDVLDIIHIVVDIKDELEKIREQVQNIL